MFLGSFYSKQYGPRSDFSQGEQSDHKKQTTFSGQIKWGDKVVSFATKSGGLGD